jgi:hypothetical protein
MPQQKGSSSVDVELEWQEAVQRVNSWWEHTPAALRGELEMLGRRLMEQKRSLQGIVARVEASSHCAGCGGACCVTGRYHFTPVDLVAYLVAGEPLFQPLFANGLCPYLGEQGCLMAPQFRPFNCITFNCELIEDRLTPEELSGFYLLERELRLSYREIRSLCPAGSLGGSLL